MSRRKRTVRRHAGIAGAAIMVTGIAAAGTAGAATGPVTPALGAPTAVAQGINPARFPTAVAGPSVVGSTPVKVSFVMKAKDLPALEGKVDAGWKGSYLTPSSFASTYGASPAIIAELTKYLAGYGITSHVLAGNLDVETSGIAADYNKALRIELQSYAVPSAGGRGTQHVYASKSNPTLPAKVANAILSVLGLSNYAPFASSAAPAVAPVKAPSASGGIPAGDRVPADFTNDYGLSTLESAGANGQGQTIGIVTLASVNPGVPETFWSKYLHLPTSPNRLSTVDVDGGSGPPSLAAGSDETDLDSEQSGAIADRAQVRVYQSPNTDNGFADGFFTAAAEDTAGSVSASWGESETAEADAQYNGASSPTYQQAYDEAFLQLAAQGQATFLSAGDSGAYTATRDTGTTNLVVDQPADTPYATSAGGTTLAGTQTYPVLDPSTGQPTGASQSVTIPFERAWSWDYLWPLHSALGFPTKESLATDLSLDEGGGGGYSGIEARPSYQDGVSGVGSFKDYQYLTGVKVSSAEGLSEPTAFTYTADPTLGSGSAPTGRAEPDLSYDADPQTGYALYDPQFQASYGTDVLEYGGTSFVAPQLNAASAVIDSSLGHRVGFWNPAIYAAAKGSSSPFNALQNDQVFSSGFYFQTSTTGHVSPLTGRFANDNLYYTGNPGATYNPATGLGIGNLAGIAAALAKAS